MIWLLIAAYVLGIIPAGALFLRTGLFGWVHETGEAVLLAFFWPVFLYVVPIGFALKAIAAAVEALGRRP
jgi:hypothetical protein